jgi:tetratricopeptide (TPR) repeat protein
MVMMKKSAFIYTAALILPTSVFGFDFTPTQAEFSTWDQRCKLAYSATGSARKSGLYPNQTKADSTKALAFAESAGGAWHYCAGVVYLKRAKASSGNLREASLKRALSEIQFTARNINKDHSWYPEIYIDMAKVHFEMGDKKAGFDTLRGLLKTHKNNSLSYTALAYYLKRNGDAKAALKVLKQAPENLQAESAELNYFLGWYSLDAGQADEAVQYATRAYQLGYPVPGLRNKLRAQGRIIP